jgi:GNAT superfamily N-acetyltransferase
MQVIYELSSEPKYLNQYYELREKCYRVDLKLAAFNGAEEQRDRTGQILIARQGEKCIGGARISDAASLLDALPGLQLPSDNSCVWERFCLDPTIRSTALAKDFLAKLIEYSRDFGFEHAVLLSSLRNARFYRLCHSALGVEFTIASKLHAAEPEQFAGLEHYLSFSTLQPDNQMLQMAA